MTQEHDPEEVEYIQYMTDVRERLADMSGDSEWLKVPLHQIPWDNAHSAEMYAQLLLDEGWEPRHFFL